MKKPRPTSGESRVEYVPISKVLPAIRNPKTHDIAGVAKSIQRYGFIAPLVENAATGRILAGHGRLEALLDLAARPEAKPPRFIQETSSGEWAVPVLKGNSFASESEAEAFLVAHNRWVEVGGWDPVSLVPMLRELAESSDQSALEAIGWSGPDIAAYLADFDPGTKARGKTPSELEAGYNGGAVQQIVAYFYGDEYQDVQARLAKVGEAEGAATGSEVLVKLLDAFEASL